MNRKDRAATARGNARGSSAGVSRAGRTLPTLKCALLLPPGPPPACYSPSSPVQVLEDPNYFFPDFLLYSGRHEASALTVEANNSIREKVGKFLYWHLGWKSRTMFSFSYLALCIIFSLSSF